MTKQAAARRSIMLSLTPSKLRDYRLCPHQYQLKHIDRVGGNGNWSSPALAFGISIHAALDAMYSPTAKMQPDDNVEKILRQHWCSNAYADEQESQSYFVRGVAALSNYRMKLGTIDGHTIGTEVFLSRVVRLADVHIRLGCKVDRLVLRSNGELVALDYKTNMSGKVPVEESLAADLGNYLYYALVRLCYPEHTDVVVAQLNVHTLAMAEVRYDEERRRTCKEELIELAKEISESRFKPSPSAACAWCPVRDYCSLFGPVIDIQSL